MTLKSKRIEASWRCGTAATAIAIAAIATPALLRGTSRLQPSATVASAASKDSAMFGILCSRQPRTVFATSAAGKSVPDRAHLRSL